MQPISKQQQTGVKKKAPKKRRCKECKKLFKITKEMMPFCTPLCQTKFVNSDENIKALVEDGKKRELKKQKEKKRDFKINDNKNLTEIAQNTVNKYIKLRDKDEPCISCGTYNAKFDAGHFESVGSDKQLRFNTLNIWKQCYHCNCKLSANKTKYRINLVKKIGLEKVEFLEYDHSIKKYTVEYLTKLIKVFRKKIKLIESRG